MGDASPAVDHPIVIVGREGNRRVVTAADRAALKVGLRVGMPATKAQALVPGLAIHESDLSGDAEALERLALWALRRYSPAVAADPPDGIIMDVSGASHLHGGEQLLVSDLVDRMHRSGFAARAAMADTWGAAHALARFGRKLTSIVPEGQGTAATVDLPIAALRPDYDVAASLRTLGFETIGELLATPRAPLTLRFGPELGRRLDQLTSVLAEPIDPVLSPNLVEVRRVFAEPIGAPETIARYVGLLVTDLCAELEARGLGVRCADLLFQLVDNTRQAIRIGTATSVRDVKRLTRLLRDKIETIDPGFGIDAMILAATWAEPFEQKQTISSLIEEQAVDVSGLVDVLANRVGEDRLYRMAPVASDVPERSASKVAAMAPDVGAAWPSHWPRPTRLLAPPEPVETMALLPDNPPVWFSWRGIRRKVASADGPERVFGEWWKRDPELAAVRDYFQVEDEAGERYWLYRAGDGEDAATGSHRWFLHGIFA